MKFEYKTRSEELASKFCGIVGQKMLKKDGEFIISVENKGLDVFNSKAYEELNDQEKNLYSAIEYLYEDMDRRLKWVWEELNFLYNALNEHTKGHLPSNLTPSQLAEAIRILGLENDYEVEKRVLYAAQGMRLVKDENGSYSVERI